MAVIFNNVEIEGSDSNNPSTLLNAAKLAIILDPIEIIQGNYSVEGVKLIDGHINMEVSKNGVPNYDIFKSPSSGKSDLHFELRTVTLSNVSYTYHNKSNRLRIELESSLSNAGISLDKGLYNIQSDGDFFIKSINSNNKEYFKEKNIELFTILTYDNKAKKVSISPSALQVEGSEFNMYGDYSFDGSREVAIHLEANETTLSTITALLPKSLAHNLSQYESKGEAYFDLSLVGNIDGSKGPKLDIAFGINNTDLKKRGAEISISNANAEGRFTSTGIYEINNSEFVLKSITGKLNKKPFKGELYIENFSKPYLELDFDGELDLEQYSQFIVSNDSMIMAGIANLDISFKGKIDHLKSKQLAQKIKASGQLQLIDANIESSKFNLGLNKLNGVLLFNNNDIAFEKLSGSYGQSDFEFNGLFKNLWAYLLLPNEPIGIEATLKSKYINLNELLAASGQTESNYSFSVSPRLRLNVSCSVDKLAFRRFTSQTLSGKLVIKDQQIYSDEISLKGMGGVVNINGTIDARNADNINTSGELEVDHVNIDSLFYVFENFNQTFLEDKHLKGTIDSNVELTFDVDSTLTLYQESLQAKLVSTIKEGELNEFEPLQGLSKYVEEDKLDHLTFTDIASEIYIANRIIIIPEIQVGTNITTLNVSGTHNFDQEIDYSVVTPLRTKKKIDKDEAFGAIEENSTGQTLLYLKITGTTSDYSISYDKQAVRNKISSDLKKEMNELKDAFKNKGIKKKKKIELNEEDYFDWDNEEDPG